MRRNAKDEADWARTYTALAAEPRDVKRARVAAGRTGPAAAQTAGRLTTAGAESMLAMFAAEDAAFA